MGDVRPEPLKHAVQTIVGSPIKSRSLSKEPRLYAGLIELLFQVRAVAPAEGDYGGFKSLAIQTEDDVNRHSLSAAGA
jgi:hypothetical protein